MAFRKGKSKTGGRKVGTPNKATVEVKELARSFLEDPAYQNNLKERLRDGRAPQIEALMFHYAYGKPTDKLELAKSMTLEELVLGSMELEEEEMRPGAMHSEDGD